MTQPSAPHDRPIPLAPPWSGSTSHTWAIAATAIALGVWAALTWGAPWLAHPMSDAWVAAEVRLGWDRIGSEDDG